MLDFANMKRGEKLIDRDDDEHTFIAYTPEVKTGEPVVTIWEGRVTAWGVEQFPVPTQVAYINIYRDLDPDRCGTREEADERAFSTRIACVRVEFIEGQFDA